MSEGLQPTSPIAVRPLPATPVAAALSATETTDPPGPATGSVRLIVEPAQDAPGFVYQIVDAKTGRLIHSHPDKWFESRLTAGDYRPGEAIDLKA